MKHFYKKIVYFCVLITFSGCGKSQPAHNPPFVQKNASEDKPKESNLKIPPVIDSGNNAALFVRLTLSLPADQFISDQILHGLALPPVPNKFERHVTLVTVKAKSGSQAQKRRGLELISNGIHQYLSSLQPKIPAFSFEVNRSHSFPGNTCFIALSASQTTTSTLNQFHEEVYNQMNSLIHQNHLQNILIVDTFSTPSNFFPHLTIHKGQPLKNSCLTVSELDQVKMSIDQKISVLKNHENLETLVLDTLKISF